MGKRVQKVLRPHEDEPLEDMGIPGKLYFDKPQVINMASFRKNKLPEFDPIAGTHGKLGPEEFYAKESPLRLKSSKKMMGREPPPDEIVYALSQRPSQEEVYEYLKINKINGYGEGSIVTRRYQEKWRFKWQGNWGLITRVVGQVPWNSSEPWAPYVVQWFERPDVPNENAWAEDLVLIHTTLDKDLLESILEAQGVTGVP